MAVVNCILFVCLQLNNYNMYLRYVTTDEGKAQINCHAWMWGMDNLISLLE